MLTAASRDASGRRLPMISTQVAKGSTHMPCGEVDAFPDCSGTVTSDASPTFTPAKPRGSTPTIVNGIPFMEMPAPITDGLPPKRRCQ